MDNGQTIGLTTVPLLQGFAARATFGLATTFAGGGQISAGGEVGGLGNDMRIWTWTMKGSVPF